MIKIQWNCKNFKNLKCMYAHIWIPSLKIFDAQYGIFLKSYICGGSIPLPRKIKKCDFCLFSNLDIFAPPFLKHQFWYLTDINFQKISKYFGLYLSKIPERIFKIAKFSNQWINVNLPWRAEISAYAPKYLQKYRI